MDFPDDDFDDAGVFYLDDTTLLAEGNVYWENVDEFRRLAAGLLEGGGDVFTIDLSSASFIASDFVGSLSDFLFAAGARGKKVVIRVSLDIRWLFDIMGELDMVEIEEV